MNNSINYNIFRALICILIFLFANTPLIAKEENKESIKNFQHAKANYRYSFPKDHKAHNEFASEWWYYTGILQGNQKQSFGYQLTFFRVGLNPKESENIYLAHFAITDLKNKQFYYFDRINRPLLQMAGIKEEKNLVFLWNKNWSAQIKNTNEHYLKAIEGDIELNLNLYNSQSPIIQGKPNEGISRKGNCETCASHYYSCPHLKTKGQIKIGKQNFDVSGLSWMDHEFGSNQLQKNQEGWDWFSLNFDDGNSLMIYQIRENNGTISAYTNGNFIFANGRTQYLDQKDIFIKPIKSWQSPHTKTLYPLIWEITIPKLGLGLKVMPLVLDQELQTKNSTNITYWEGAIKAVDRVSGKKCAQGYLELTGYSEKMKNKI